MEEATARLSAARASSPALETTGMARSSDLLLVAGVGKTRGGGACRGGAKQRRRSSCRVQPR